MKKVYTKPVMESEEFVSNEYVAACWTITCTNDDGSCGKEIGIGDYPEGLDINSGFGTYNGLINGKSGCRSEYNSKDYDFSSVFWKDIPKIIEAIVDFFTGQGGTETEYHPVKVTEGYEKNGTFHPNASV